MHQLLNHLTPNYLALFELVVYMCVVYNDTAV